jgi:hypothetical protein
LKQENALLRVLEGGDLVSVPITHFDSSIVPIATIIVMMSQVSGILLAGLGLACFVGGQLALAALLSRSRDLATAVTT